MVKKEKINYSCLCGMDFGNRIDNYNRHMNKKNPCFGVAPKAPELPQILPQNIPLCIEIKPIYNEIETKKDEIKPIYNEIETEKDEIEPKEEIKNKFSCPFCFQNFVKKYGLNRHLDGRCKLKPDNNKSIQNNIDTEQNNNKSIQNNTDTEQNNNKSNDNDDKLNFIIKQLNELKNENEKLKKQIKRTKKNKTIINQNNININQNNILINFNDLNLEDVDKKLFITPLLNSRLQGKFIILQMIENVYINKDHPEYQNILITDKNRGYVKIYNDGKWKTDNIETINMIIDGIINHSKNILIELKQQYLNNNNAKNRLNTSEKYVNLCDLEYLGDLEDEQLNEDVNNKDKIKRCKDFREMVYKDTINLFHDNKKILLKPKNNKIIELN